MNRRGTRVAVAHWKWRWFMIFSAFMRLVYFIINFHVNIWKTVIFYEVSITLLYKSGLPHPAKMRLCPAPSPPCENNQNLWGAKLISIQWNSEGNYKEGSNFVRLIFASLTNQLIYALFLPHCDPPREFFPCPAPPHCHLMAEL